MIDVSLLDSDLDAELQSSVEAVLAKSCDPARLIAMFDGDRGVASDLWRILREDIGLAGLLIPENKGGVGLNIRQAAVVMEELGRFVAPTPFLTSAIVATTVLLGTSADATVRDLASGKCTAAIALPFSAGPTGWKADFEVDASGRLSGAARSVAGAIEADILIIPARHGDRISLYLVAASDLAIEPRVSLDMTRQVADVSSRDVQGELIAENAEQAVFGALLAGAVALSSEQVGIASHCLNSSVDYLKERRQFGRPLGSFQSLKHRLADLYVAVESASAAARYAAATLAEADKDAESAAAVAQSYCSDIAVLAAEEAVQLHAGMGMTWEHSAHLYLKRAKADQIAFGTAGHYRARLADLIDLQFSVA